MSASNDGSESVDQFLARIASVKEGRDRDSEERAKRVEEDFLKNRKERQARRLERARSLSPSKTGPARPTSVLSSPAPIRDLALNPPVDFSPAATSLSRSNAVSLKTSPKLEPQRTEPDPVTSPAAISNTPPATTLSRSGTLSWQQRPSPGSGFARPRPLSTIATVRPIPEATGPQPSSPKQMSREEIATSLAAKDPTWFRQTQERGASSAAYRKNQVEDTPVIDASTRSMRLPGLSGESSNITDSPRLGHVDGTARVSRPLPEWPSDSVGVSYRSSESPKPNITRLTDSPRSPKIDGDSKQPNAVVEGETRSPSPTKGLGGFVQSAMMKRSDSVSKRWSVQANAGLKRGDSVAGMRPLSGRVSPQKANYAQEKQLSRAPISPSVLASNPDSRPGSTHGVARPLPASTAEASNDQSNAKDHTEEAVERPRTPTDDDGLARSPSKTMDQRRWSPTKSSWLESTLLAKADPPAIIPKKEEQPQWMVDLKRTKSTRDASPQKQTARRENAPSPVQRTPIKSTGLNKPAKPLPTKTESAKPEVPTPSSKVKADPSPSSIEDLQANEIEEEDAKLPPSLASEIHQVNDPVSATRPTTSVVSAWNNLEKKPPVVKPKPQTPPKTDFRSSLRARAPTGETKSNDEPEFKSMFGKLKSAQTKNYVAPDTLKNNILSGKAALTVTDGPQKTKRVDEFKESILQKKEAMKATALDKKQDVASGESSKQETSLPEALQRRKTLHKATPSVTRLQDTISSAESLAQTRPRPVIGAKPRDKAVDPHAEVGIRKPQLAPQQQKAAAVTTEKQDHGPQTSMTESTIVRPAQKSPGPKKPEVSRSEAPGPVMPNSGDRVASPAAPTSASSVAAGRLPANSKLASRLNPDLAAFLSKGNVARPTAVTSPSSENVASLSQPRSAGSTAKEESEGVELTHMTKGRARGPKRRAPKAASSTAHKRPVQANSRGSPSPMRQSAALKDTVDSTVRLEDSNHGPNNWSKPITEAPTNTLSETFALKRTQSPVSKPQPPTSSKTKPTIAAKSADVRKASGSLALKNEVSSEVKHLSSQQFDIAEDRAVTPSRHESTSTPIRPITGPKPAVSPLPLTPSKTRINTPPVKPGNPKPVNGWGVAARSTLQQPESISLQQKSVTCDGEAKSDTQETIDVATFTQKYFPVAPSHKDKLEFDTQTLLQQPVDPEKIKTLSNTIWELGGDGKKASMPPQQEHILFEDSMYLVVHTFEAAGSKRSEVFLWHGDRVSQAAVEDVQLFCKKDAREHNTKLDVIRQGKEPASFFQALGGIVITRRNRVSALYMLCGRKHLGHIAFDEVDLAAESLCSGFPYLISAKFGSLYLWKGKGSAIDEVGCARLIGMDLGLVGEIEEIDEGAEPSSFWDAFPESGSVSTPRKWAPAWHERAKHGGYPTTLYRIEQERPKSSGGGFWGLRPTSPSKPTGRATVDRIEPFCQRDIEPASVYILDTHHTVYVLLNPKSVTKTPEVSTALHFAQEVAMLSPSIQNRRLQPSCYVVFGDPPPDVKACFRKWQGQASSGTEAAAGVSRAVHDNPTNQGPTACLRLEDVMQALGL